MEKYHRLVILLLILATAVTLGSYVFISNNQNASQPLAIDSGKQVAQVAAPTTLVNFAKTATIWSKAGGVLQNSYCNTAACGTGHTLSQAVDTNPGTYWCSASAVAAVPAGSPSYEDFVYLDLGSNKPIDKIEVDQPVASGSNPCNYAKRYEIYTQAAGGAWARATTTYAMVPAGSTKTTATLTFSSPVNARYVKFRAIAPATVPNRLAVSDFRVWGKEAAKADLIIQDVVRAPNGDFMVSIKNIGNSIINKPARPGDGVCYTVFGRSAVGEYLFNEMCLDLSAYPIAPNQVVSQIFPVSSYAGTIYVGVNGFSYDVNNVSSGIFASFDEAKIIPETSYVNNSIVKDIGSSISSISAVSSNLTTATGTSLVKLGKDLTSKLKSGKSISSNQEVVVVNEGNQIKLYLRTFDNKANHTDILFAFYDAVEMACDTVDSVNNAPITLTGMVFNMTCEAVDGALCATLPTTLYGKYKTNVDTTITILRIFNFKGPSVAGYAIGQCSSALGTSIALHNEVTLIVRAIRFVVRVARAVTISYLYTGDVCTEPGEVLGFPTMVPC